MHNLQLLRNQLNILKYLFILGFALLALPGWAESKSTDKIKSVLQQRLGPAVTIRGISPTPLAGLYEVNLGNQIIYTDAQAHYIIQGHLIDLEKGESLTENRLNEINRVNFSEFPLEQAIAVTRGNGQRKLVVFADPNCGYCKRLEQSLKNTNNLTIYTFLTPILSADSTNKAKQIWCATNRSKAWQDWTLQNIVPSDQGKCHTPIEKNVALANRLNVQATPTLFFSDGSRISGAAPIDAIERKLSGIK